MLTGLDASLRVILWSNPLKKGNWVGTAKMSAYFPNKNYSSGHCTSVIAWEWLLDRAVT